MGLSGEQQFVSYGKTVGQSWQNKKSVLENKLFQPFVMWGHWGVNLFPS